LSLQVRQDQREPWERTVYSVLLESMDQLGRREKREKLAIRALHFPDPQELVLMDLKEIQATRDRPEQLEIQVSEQLFDIVFSP